jgi:hypothetical protein
MTEISAIITAWNLTEFASTLDWARFELKLYRFLDFASFGNFLVNARRITAFDLNLVVSATIYNGRV